MLDFTLDTYRLFLDSLDEYYKVTVNDYLKKLPSTDFIILRHDVDRLLNNALQMARLESEKNIHSTYYFRVGKRLNLDIVKRINKLGHEIGYHYEVLSKANGDYDLAIRLFEKELELLRSVCEVKTISMHGKPISKWDNNLIWDKYAFESFGIIGDCSRSIRGIPYFTDTGRSWGGNNNIRDLPMDNKDLYKVKDTYQLIKLIKSKHHKSFFLNIHPERWSNSYLFWLGRLFLDWSMNLTKRVIKNSL
jgi:hypothetical protein